MTKFQKIVSLLLAAGLVLGIAGIYVLNRSIESIQFQYGGYDYYRENPVNEEHLARRIGEEVAKQGSLFASVKEILRTPDAERFAIALEVTAIPKEFTENTTAQLSVGDQSIAMAQKNGAFVGEIAIPLDAGETEYFIQLRDGNTYRSQAVLTNVAVFSIGEQVFGTSGMSSSFSTTESSTEYHMGEIFKLDESMLPFGDKAVSARLYAVQEGKEIFSEPMQNGFLEMNHTFKLKQGVSIELCGEVVGESGLTYRYVIYEMTQDDGRSANIAIGRMALLIIGKDGQSMEVETVDF